MDALKNEISDAISTHGTGGMQSKIEAATIAQQSGIETWIVNGLRDNFIIDSFQGNAPFTKITT